MLDAVTQLVASARDLHHVDPDAFATLLNAINLVFKTSLTDIEPLAA